MTDRASDGLQAFDVPRSRGRRAGIERNSIYRIFRHKLIVPVLRSRQTPEYTARGVMVGMVSAMTPLVGIQMMLVGGAWAFLDRVLKWRFSLAQGLTWTWVTNVFTMIPFYYLFYVTGQAMMGRSLSGYASFQNVIQSVLATPGSFWDKTVAWCVAMVSEWGLPMVVGCVPWAILFGWASYAFAYRLVQRHQKARRKRNAAAS